MMDEAALADALDRLSAGGAEVLAAFAGMDAATATRQPADGGWDARSVAYHLLDIERWYIAKLCEAVTDDPASALQRFLAVWQRLRAETIALAAALSPDRLGTPGLLSGVPGWTPALLLKTIAQHDAEHAEQVAALRAAAETTD